jgi:putative inorganic carbon (HCO3(-)) transporter
LPSGADVTVRVERGWDWLGFLLVAMCLGIVQFSIAIAQSLFGLAFLLWLYLTVKERRWTETPAFFLPLLVYGGLTLVSSAVSFYPRASFWDSRQVWLWFVVPVVARFARGDRASVVMNVIIAFGAIGATVGVVEYAMLGYDDLAHRPKSTLSHYMTYSGLLMLVACAATSRLIFYTRERLWPAITIPALLVALVVTQARNAWIGMIAALTALLAARRPLFVAVVPALIVVFMIAAPANLRQRGYSIVNPRDDSNRDRIQMLQMGRHMVADHPWFGVGPEAVQRLYAQYLLPNPVHTYNPHLHNVPMQIAAERGLPALAAWLWFIVVALRDLFRQLSRGPARAIAGAGAASVVAMLFAGLFEYNFGDSEFLMLFLGLITLPFAAAQKTEAAATFTTEVQARAQTA